MAILEGGLVQTGRIRVLKEAPNVAGGKNKGAVVYWMLRDHRSRDNWALLHAVDLANRGGKPVAVAFNLFLRFLCAHALQLGFTIRGLRELRDRLTDLGIPFSQGEAAETTPRFLEDCEVSVLVTDFSPLREVRKTKDEICRRVGASVAVHEVDAHNVVPLWIASGKLEYSAKTLRSKLHKLLPEHLVKFPELQTPIASWSGKDPPEIDWDAITANILREGAAVKVHQWRF